MRILIAEDDAVSRMMLHAMLGQWGHEVIAASDGLQALELLEKPDAPALALLDWMMPGISGPEICQAIKARQDGRGRYLILLTSNSRKEDIVAGLQAGADDYVVKPFDEDELRARVTVGGRVVRLHEELIEARQRLARPRART